MITMKVAIGINTDYLKLHADDIINNTSVLLNPYPFGSLEFSDDQELRRIAKEIDKKQLESGNSYMFGPGQYFIKAGENEGEALERIEHEYCEATGHWDLYIWEEIGE